MNQNRARHGLTLIEVLVALVVLAIGVMAVAQLQASSLRFSSQAEQIKSSTQIAEAEAEWHRQTEMSVGVGQACQSYVPDGYTCQVDVVECNATGGAQVLTCAEGLVSPVAYQIRVTVGGRSIEPFTLRTVTTGNFVAGVQGDESTADPPADPPEDGGDETEEEDDSDERPCLEYAGKSGKCKKWGD